MFNRRGFIGALAGILGFVKSGFSRSPAESASPPTCKDSKVSEIDEATNTITICLDSVVPSDAVGRMFVMSPVRSPMDDIPYYKIPTDGAARMGLKRS